MNIRKISQKQEERLARTIGGRPQVASGALPNARGDARANGKIRAEAKFTAKKSYTLHHVDLLKLRAQALSGSVEQPVFVVGFRQGRGYGAEAMDEYVVIPMSYYQELLGEKE